LGYYLTPFVFVRSLIFFTFLLDKEMPIMYTKFMGFENFFSIPAVDVTH